MLSRCVYLRFRSLNSDNRDFVADGCHSGRLFKRKKGLRRRDMVNVGEVSILLIKVQSVANHKNIGYRKTHVIRFHGNNAARVLVEQSGEL